MGVALVARTLMVDLTGITDVNEKLHHKNRLIKDVSGRPINLSTKIKVIEFNVEDFLG